MDYHGTRYIILLCCVIGIWLVIVKLRLFHFFFFITLVPVHLDEFHANNYHSDIACAGNI